MQCAGLLQPNKPAGIFWDLQSLLGCGNLCYPCPASTSDSGVEFSKVSRVCIGNVSSETLMVELKILEHAGAGQVLPQHCCFLKAARVELAYVVNIYSFSCGNTVLKEDRLLCF